MLIENITWPEFKKAIQKKLPVIIPISPLEEHGPHLPLGTDFIRPQELLNIVNKKVNCLIFPVIPLGNCTSTKIFPGSISLNYETLKHIIIDIVKNLIDHKVKKIIIVSGHAGKIHRICIKNGLSEIKNQYSNINLHYVEMRYLRKDTPKGLIITENDSHAGEIETSEMIYLKSTSVRKNKLTRGFWKRSKTKILSTKDYAQFVSKNGIHGDATKATKNKGKKLIEIEVKRLIEIIKEK